MSYEKRKSQKLGKLKPETLLRWAEKDTDRKHRRQNEEYARKLQELKKLSKDMSAYIKRRTIQDEETEKLKNIPLPSQAEAERIEASAKLLEAGKEHGFDASKSSLATSAAALPALIQEKLGLAVKYLVSREHQNWSIVLHELGQTGLEGVSEKDIRKLVYTIPKTQLKQIYPQVQALLAENNIRESPKMVNAYLKAVVAGPKVSDEDREVIERAVENLKKSNKKGKLSRETYEILVETYGKCSDIDQMNETVKEMKAVGLQPLLNVYSNVLSTCVYKARDHKQAVQLFDLMKFLAGLLAPKTREYQDIIVSYVNSDDIERALDLYQEMLIKNLPLNQSILVALARGCMSREPLRFKAWDFIFEIYNNKWEPTVQTLEYMLYLAAKDGDLALARALYQQLNLSNATSPRSFSFLLLAYAKLTIGRPVSEFQPLAITAHEAGRNFRRNILDLADFSPKLDNPKRAVPFLPLVVLTQKSELLAELSAIMAHALMVHPNHVNVESVNTFMNVAAKMGTLDEFTERYAEFTFLDRTGVRESQKDMEVIIEPEVLELFDTEILEKSEKFTTSPILKQVVESRSVKVARNTITYLIALQAAAKHKNYIFAQEIWKERGLYRKLENFRKLPRDVKDSLDFSFASGMVNCLTELNLLDDALAILVSTEYQFKWTWKELRPLYSAAVEVGHANITRTVRGIVKRAQVNHEGKIRKRDYKRYVMERGY